MNRSRAALWCAERRRARFSASASNVRSCVMRLLGLVYLPTLTYTWGMTSFRSLLSARSLRHGLVLVCAAASVGCGSGVLVEPVSVKAAPPGRVVALVSVSDHGSAPGDLNPDNFEVREG